MPNPIKTSADKIVEKYFDEICHHSEKGKLCRDLQTVWAEPMAIKLAILEVEACIELLELVSDECLEGKNADNSKAHFNLILTELKSRIV